jgi:hypothetical protein
VALDSFDEALDAETVLWAVRGMNGARLGVSAEDVVRFLSKDTTLSTHYDRENVGVLLDSLRADGMLSYEPATGEWAAIDANATMPDPVPVVARHGDFSETGLDQGDSDAGTEDANDAFTQAFAGLASAEADANPPTTLGEAVAGAFLRLRVDELERERNELSAELDQWRHRAESAEHDASCARSAGDELEARVRELEHLLDRERAAGHERSDTTRRAAVALARAQQELETIGPLPAKSGAGAAQLARSRRTLRGNWLI